MKKFTKYVSLILILFLIISCEGESRYIVLNECDYIATNSPTQFYSAASIATGGLTIIPTTFKKLNFHESNNEFISYQLNDTGLLLEITKPGIYEFDFEFDNSEQEFDKTFVTKQITVLSNVDTELCIDQNEEFDFLFERLN